MAAFNYHQLICQVPARTWQFYFASRKVSLPDDHDWAMPAAQMVPALIDATDAIETDLRNQIYSELRRVHALANLAGMDALRNNASPDSAVHEDFSKLSSDAERALWVMANWPELFTAAEAICGVNQRIGKRGWKRLQVLMPTRNRGLAMQRSPWSRPSLGVPTLSRFQRLTCWLLMRPTMPRQRVTAW